MWKAGILAMTVEQDYDALADRLNRENVREENTLGMTILDMETQLAVLQRQRRNRRHRFLPSPPASGSTGASGPAI